jgi:low affinity Fe/Cu permease
LKSFIALWLAHPFNALYGEPMWKRANEWASRMASRTANLSGSPIAILLVAVFCTVWFLRAGQAGENTLTLILSVASITLTQMVLKRSAAERAGVTS